MPSMVLCCCLCLYAQTLEYRKIVYFIDIQNRIYIICICGIIGIECNARKVKVRRRLMKKGNLDFRIFVFVVIFLYEMVVFIKVCRTLAWRHLTTQNLLSSQHINPADLASSQLIFKLHCFDELEPLTLLYNMHYSIRFKIKYYASLGTCRKFTKKKCQKAITE